MVCDDLRLFLQDQPVLHILIITQERFNLIQLSGQDDRQVRILPQCFQGSFYRCFRRQVSAHRVNVDRHVQRPRKLLFMY